MNAEKLALALGGNRSGSEWMAHCPAPGKVVAGVCSYQIWNSG